MLKLYCKNPKCLNEFFYHGKKKKEIDRIPCPKCKYVYPLWKLKMKNSDSPSPIQKNSNPVKIQSPKPQPPKSPPPNFIQTPEKFKNPDFNLFPFERAMEFKKERARLNKEYESLPAIIGGVNIKDHSDSFDSIEQERARLDEEYKHLPPLPFYPNNTQDGSTRKNEQKGSIPSFEHPENNQKLGAKEKSESYNKGSESEQNSSLREIPILDLSGNVEKVIKKENHGNK
jgi:hypothetical protein